MENSEVSTTTVEIIEEISSTVNLDEPKPTPMVTPKKARSRSKSLPRGKYTLVGIDIDTTGRRLIDEIVQLSAYTPNSEFGQYIMPYMNLNPAARQRHQVRVITIGFFRMLKSMQTYKMVKTKTEVAALHDFLDWIEKIKKSENSDGIILIYHEQRKFIPYMILEAFKKYDLTQRFLSCVRSFSNGYNFAEDKCPAEIKNFNLRQLSKILLNSEEDKERNQFEGNSCVRARMAYQIVQHLAKEEPSDLTQEIGNETMLNAIYGCVNPVSQDIAELRTQRMNLERQNSLRPIFLQYFKTTLYHRVKAVTFRRVLSESGQDFESLQKMWTENKKESLNELISKFQELKVEEHTELVEILDCHFDPDKTPVKPPTRTTPKRRTNSRRSSGEDGVSGSTSTGRNKENSKSQQNSGDEAHSSPKTSTNNNNSGVEGVSPDTTFKSRHSYRNKQNKSRQSAGGNNQTNEAAAVVAPITSQSVTA